MAKVAFIGLGVMGYPMAGHLLTKGGHDVCVYNRSTAKADKWVAEFGGTSAPTPKDAADGADFIFTCVGNDDDLRSVTMGDHGALKAMKPGAILIDNTTASAEIARELAKACADQQGGFLDAPISGGQAGAENGILTVMVGGDPDTFKKAEPIIACYARMVGHMGDVGAGQLTKMVNQICIAGLVQALSEGINFGKRAGLDMDKVINVISKGAAGSWQMENRYQTMLNDEYNHGFAVDWMRKDLAIVLAESEKNGASLSITALTDQFYKDVQSMGGNRWDTSSLLARLEKLNG